MLRGEHPPSVRKACERNTEPRALRTKLVCSGSQGVSMVLGFSLQARALSVMKTPGSTLFGINALKLDKTKVACDHKKTRWFWKWECTQVSYRWP
eukprot:5716493-Amphidinium_carterae.1